MCIRHLLGSRHKKAEGTDLSAGGSQSVCQGGYGWTLGSISEINIVIEGQKLERKGRLRQSLRRLPGGWEIELSLRRGKEVSGHPKD